MDVREKILKESKVIAVVGISDNPERASHEVAEYLQSEGYTIVPVNPRLTTVLGQTCYPDLVSIGRKVDAVDIFRRPEEVLPVVQQAIRIGARAIWMQEGVVNEEAAALAREAGLDVVMDHCMLKERRRLLSEGKLEG
ncbi:MAG: CoA-binding protein [Chloroflexi bacterium]|nr:CoA-binding protein [Chloroflexota bacterium]